jgi:hypothetical protein
MATKTVTKGLIGKEDISFADPSVEPDDETFLRTASGGSTQTITKLHANHLPIEDENGDITATNVGDALEEIAGDVSNQKKVYSDGKGLDVASAAVIDLGSGNELYFDVTGTQTIRAITQTGVVSGRLLVLKFDAECKVEKNNLLRLNGGSFYPQAGDHMVLINDNSITWYELARSTAHDLRLIGDDDDTPGTGIGTISELPQTSPFGTTSGEPIAVLPTGGDLQPAPSEF